MPSDARLCRCCGTALPLGLFSRLPHAAVPDAVQRMRNARVTDETITTPHLVVVGGRCFALADASLPVSDPDSPVQVRVWTEIEPNVLTVLSAAIERDQVTQADAVLASDWPGFPGSLGSRVTLQTVPGARFPRVTSSEDTRLRRLEGKLSHEHYTLLYRGSFGNAAAVADADPQLRALTAQAWRDVAGRPTFTKDIEPPAALAGISPARLVIAPPLDTGGDAMLGTVGIAEAAQQGACELVTWVRDPDESFITTFGEFCYWSRLTGDMPTHGGFVPEPPRIGGTAGMVAWLFCEPWWTDLGSVTLPDRPVTLLAAVPIWPAELKFAAQAGSLELLERMETYGVDVADLDREPCVS